MAPPRLPSDPDVLILGAGAAGIAAARDCAALGLTCLVLEARGRVGGRAWTDTATLGAPFDLGATWLHAAARNPLTPLARERGIRLADHDALRAHRLWMGTRWATPAEAAEYDAAYDAWMEALRAVPPEPDRSVAAAAPRGGPWDASIAAWEGPTISGAELPAMSLADFLANQLEPPNLLPEPGVGALLAALAEGLPVALSHPVARLRVAGGAVRAEGEWGAVTGRGAIVTLPASLLAGGALRIEPGLPAPVEAALHGLPLGLLTKIGLRATGADRLGLPPFAGLERRAAEGEGEGRMTFVAWPFGRDHLTAFVGGDRAWALEREGPRALVAAALEELAGILGGRARAALSERGALVSAWGGDPWSRGAYSYARPGMAPARRLLAEPLAGGRLFLAGEHLHPTLSGTVGGAWETGRDAARALAAVLRGSQAPAGSPARSGAVPGRGLHSG